MRITTFLIFSIPVALATDYIVQNYTLSRVAFGSCHKNKYKDRVNWPLISSKDPDIFLWTGDAIYPPTRKIASLEMMKEEYAKTKATEYGRVLKPPLGIYGTWDDHDFGANDLGKDMPDKAARADVYYEFLGLERPVHDGIYSSIVVGEPPEQVKIILLDTRWFREEYCIPSFATRFPLAAGIACATRWISAGLLSRFCDPNKSVLGETQWQWLKDELDASEASVHVIVSSIQVTTTNPVMESWGHFPNERRRLLSLLSEKKNVLLLSGDVHYGEIIGDLEVTSSALTHDCSHHIYGPLCVPLLQLFGSESYFVGPNFGILEIDWSKREYTVSVNDMSGNIILSRVMWLRETPGDLTNVPELMNDHLVPLAGTISIVIFLLLTMFVLRLRRREAKIKTS